LIFVHSEDITVLPLRPFKKNCKVFNTELTVAFRFTFMSRRFHRRLGELLVTAPEYDPKIRELESGLKWLGRDRFLCHGKTVARLLGIHPESLGRDFRNNGYTTDTSRPHSKTLEDPRGWKVHAHAGLDRKALIEAAGRVTFDPIVAEGTAVVPFEAEKAEENRRELPAMEEGFWETDQWNSVWEPGDQGDAVGRLWE
jgi:hypothetical protein